MKYVAGNLMKKKTGIFILKKREMGQLGLFLFPFSLGFLWIWHGFLWSFVWIFVEFCLGFCWSFCMFCWIFFFWIGLKNKEYFKYKKTENKNDYIINNIK